MNESMMKNQSDCCGLAKVQEQTTQDLLNEMLDNVRDLQNVIDNVNCAVYGPVPACDEVNGKTVPDVLNNYLRLINSYIVDSRDSVLTIQRTLQEKIGNIKIA